MSRNREAKPSRAVGGGFTQGQVFVSSRHRSELEVAYDILDAIRHGTHTKTQLMFVTYLPHEQVDKAVLLMVPGQLISEMHPGTYDITRKGLTFLNADHARMLSGFSWIRGLVDRLGTIPGVNGESNGESNKTPIGSFLSSSP